MVASAKTHLTKLELSRRRDWLELVRERNDNFGSLWGTRLSDALEVAEDVQGAYIELCRLRRCRGGCAVGNTVGSLGDGHFVRKKGW